MKNKKIDKCRFSTSKNLWKRAKKSIAGGNHLISKNPESLPIDIKSKRFLIYTSYSDLQEKIRNELFKLNNRI